jgi:hypothetical protein
MRSLSGVEEVWWDAGGIFFANGDAFLKPFHCTDHHPIRIEDERERLVTASPVMTKSRAPTGGNNYPENGLVKPPRRDTRAFSPAGMFGGKAPLHIAAQKSRLHAPSVPMRSAPAYFLCKWGVKTRLDLWGGGGSNNLIWHSARRAGLASSNFHLSSLLGHY